MTKILWAIPILFAGISLNAQTKSDTKLHFKSIVIDTHNDFPNASVDKKCAFDTDLTGRTHSDLQRMKKAGLDIQVFSIWCDGLEPEPFKMAMREIDSVHTWVNRNPTKMQLVSNSNNLLSAVKRKKLGAMMGVEGGHMIENDLSKLQAFFDRGARYMTLTWNNSTSWASSARDESSNKPMQKGLNDFGKQLVSKMNELGMLIDLSHVGEQTFWDVMKITTKPVLISHSCAAALCPKFRNLTDEQILAVGKNGGSIHINFYSGFLDSTFDQRSEAFDIKHQAEIDSLTKINPEPYFAHHQLFEKYPEEVKDLRPNLSLLIDHIDHIVKLIGVAHVGLGSDFDGINSAPQQLEDVTGLIHITSALKNRGYSNKDIKKILGENFIRILKANEIK